MKDTAFDSIRAAGATVTGIAGLAAIAIAQIIRDAVPAKPTRQERGSSVPGSHDAGRAY